MMFCAVLLFTIYNKDTPKQKTILISSLFLHEVEEVAQTQLSNECTGEGGLRASHMHLELPDFSPFLGNHQLHQTKHRSLAILFLAWS